MKTELVEHALPVRAIMLANRRRIIKGFLEAYERFRVQASKDVLSDNADASRDTFIPLFDSLNWAASLLEDLRVRQGLTLPQTLHRLRFVRNRVHHSWAAALEPHFVDVEAHAGPLTLCGRSFDGWYWRAVDNLPDPNGHPDKKGREAYQACLEGRLVEEALAEVVRFTGTEVQEETKDPTTQ